MATRTGSWFLSQTGRRFAFGVACTLGFGFAGVNILPNTVLLNKYKEIIHLYQAGTAMPVPNEVLNRFEKALHLLDVPENERRIIQPFSVFGFDIFSAGTTFTHWGSIIGIPLNFSYESKDKIQKSLIKVNNEQVDWSLVEAQQLLDSLILSENAQLFALAREISFTRNLKCILDTSYPVFSIGFVYMFSRYYNEKLKLYTRHPSLRLTLYTILGLFGFGIYSLLKDVTQVYYETQTDKELLEKDPVFVSGGLEFYKKTIERNVALRKLLGKTGEKMYSVYGNENFFIRQKTLPITIRLSYFETKQ